MLTIFGTARPYKPKPFGKQYGLQPGAARKTRLPFNRADRIDQAATALGTEELPLANRPAVLGSRFTDALLYASLIHGGQRRKGSDIPYIGHLLGVASILIDLGADEDEVIAGLLHDAVEDQGGLVRANDIRARFGDRVADIVLACSDAAPKKRREETAVG